MRSVWVVCVAAALLVACSGESTAPLVGKPLEVFTLRSVGGGSVPVSFSFSYPYDKVTVYEGIIELAPTDSTFRDISRVGYTYTDGSLPFTKTDTIIGKYRISGFTIQFYHTADGDLVLADYIGDVITIHRFPYWWDFRRK